MTDKQKGNDSVTQDLITAAAVGTVKVASFGIDMWYTLKAVSQAVTQQIYEYNDHMKNQYTAKANNDYVQPYPSNKVVKNATKLVTCNDDQVLCKCGALITRTKNFRCQSCNQYYTIIDTSLMVECSRCKGKRLIKNAIGAHICNICGGQGLVPYQQNSQGIRGAAKKISQKQLNKQTFLDELERKIKK